MPHLSGRPVRRTINRTVLRTLGTASSRQRRGITGHVIGDTSQPPCLTQSAQRPDRSRSARTPDHFAVTAQIDSKGRVRLPKKIQEAISVAPGDSVFLDVEWVSASTPTLRVAPAINPLVSILDDLADDAERAYRAGQTVRFRDLVAEYREELRSGIDRDDNG